MVTIDQSGAGIVQKLQVENFKNSKTTDAPSQKSSPKEAAAASNEEIEDTQEDLATEQVQQELVSIVEDTIDLEKVEVIEETPEIDTDIFSVLQGQTARAEDDPTYNLAQ